MTTINAPAPTGTPAPIINEHGVPQCTVTCSQHDEKRCKLLGYSPGSICEPAVQMMARDLQALRRVVRVTDYRREEVVIPGPPGCICSPCQPDDGTDPACPVHGTASRTRCICRGGYGADPVCPVHVLSEEST